jgi:protein-disulfide isomerase
MDSGTFDGGNRYKYVLILSAIGLGAAILSGLESRVEWLASLCGFFGEGCRETTVFRLLGAPVWLWGAVYYAVLAGAALCFRPAVFWLVMAGLGAELTLVQVLVAYRWMCVFCLINAVVVILLVLFCLRKSRLWQAAAVSLLVFILAGFLLPREDPAMAQNESKNPRTTVVAKVGEKVITAQELERPLAQKIYAMQQEIYQLKRNFLEGLIDGTLLEKAASKNGMTVDQLIESITSTAAKVSDQEVEFYYQQNRMRWTNWNGTEEELRHRIRIYLQEQKNRQKITASARRLRDEFPVTVYLKEPPYPYSSVSVGDSPVQGPKDADVTIAEFSDYLCPACRKEHETSKRIRKTYAGKIRWVFKDYPLDRHEGAKKLAEAAHCAGEQGKFWEFQDMLFAFKEKPGPGELETAAQQLGLDVERFRQCYDSGKYDSKVEQHIQEAKEAGVNATPTFIINGRLHSGSLSFDEFKQMIDEELGKAGSDN